MYTDWEQDSGKQWETFLSRELPNWLAANKGLAPGGHGIVGASQGGYAAVALATFHPDRFRYAGSLSGFLTPERTGVDGAITAALRQGGADSGRMWGAPQLGRWKWHSPNQNIEQLADNGIGSGSIAREAKRPSTDQAAMAGFGDIAQGHQCDLLQPLPGSPRRQRAFRPRPRQRQRLADVGTTVGRRTPSHLAANIR